MIGQGPLGPDEEDDITHTFSQVLKVRWPVGYWLRQQFSLTSIIAILSILAAGGGWIINLKTRVVVLETRVVPVLANVREIDVLKVRVDDLEQRITRIEQDWDYARNAAGLPPTPRRAGRPQ